MAILATAILYITVILGLCDYLYMSSAGLRSIKTFFCWLKGSRISYYLSSSGSVESTTAKLRTRMQRERFAGRQQLGETIEIARGFWRRQSAIYTDNLFERPSKWEIARVSFGNNPQGGFGADWVDLVDRSSLPVEYALNLINKRSSIQELMRENGNQRNQIAELEKELSIANDRRLEWLAGTSALYLEIITDRQKYRSPAAGHIRKCLDVIIEWANQDKDRFPIELKRVMAWKERFPRNS